MDLLAGEEQSYRQEEEEEEEEEEDDLDAMPVVHLRLAAEAGLGRRMDEDEFAELLRLCGVPEGARKVPGLERIVSLERAASLHLDTLATLASKGSPLQPSVTPDTVAQHFSEPIAAERAVAV